MTAADETLAGKLEGVTEASIDWIGALLAVPLDIENGHLMRAQVAAAGFALNAQLRADAMRLRALRDDKALSALIAVIASKERIVPDDTGRNLSGLSALDFGPKA